MDSIPIDSSCCRLRSFKTLSYFLGPLIKLLSRTTSSGIEHRTLRFDREVTENVRRNTESGLHDLIPAAVKVREANKSCFKLLNNRTNKSHKQTINTRECLLGSSKVVLGELQDQEQGERLTGPDLIT